MLKNVFKSLKNGMTLIVNKNLTKKRCEEVSETVGIAERSIIASIYDPRHAGKKCTILGIDYRDKSVYVQFEDGLKDYLYYKFLRKIRKHEK